MAELDEERLDRIEALFKAAQLHPQDERSAFLEAACGDDEELRLELESLLDADLLADRHDFMKEVPRELLDFPQVVEEDDFVNRFVGPYQILRRLGRGGMGDVFLALRNEPFKQYIALKVLRPSLDAKELRSRFEMEQQILASLNHPNIARIVDGGATDEGLPYIAMEYVEGKPITAFCDENGLDVRERLSLFRTVCEAVHYAHRNLIIHRDLKPSNILVTNDGVVKLLDFGIAKLLNPGMSPVTVPLTREYKLMTPEYASPEQIRGDALSTSADVYSLGVVLYELLTGTGPYILNQRSTEEITRAVIEQEPVRPSTRIRRVGEARKDRRQPETGILRHLPPDRLERKLRGDLDNIVLKALRKEPELRFLSAGQIAADIRRYLEGLPVEARPATMGYRIRKFVRRNRAAVAIGSVTVALLIAFTISTAIQAALLQERSHQLTLEAQSSQAASDFIVDLFNVNNPTLGSKVDTLTLSQFVEMNADRVRTELGDQPLLKARVLRTLGEVNRSLGRYDESLALLQEALETQRNAGITQSEDMARTLHQLGDLATDRGEYAEAEVIQRRAIEMSMATAGELAPLTSQSVLGLAAALEGQARTEDAEAEYLRALQLATRAHGDEHPTTAQYHRILGTFYRTIGNLDRAYEELTRSRDLYAILQGVESTEYARSIAQIALVERLRSRLDVAIDLFNRALRIFEKNLGREHSHYPATLNDLALTYASNLQFDQAESAYRETIALNKRILGEKHHNTIANHLNLAILLTKQERYEEAYEYATTALRSWREIRPEDHWNVAVAQYALGDILTRQGRFSEAEALLLDSYEKLLTAFGRYHYQTRVTAELLHHLYAATGDSSRAAQYLELATRLSAD